jgi:hypothetical protein
LLLRRPFEGVLFGIFGYEAYPQHTLSFLPPWRVAIVRVHKSNSIKNPI